MNIRYPLPLMPRHYRRIAIAPNVEALHPIQLPHTLHLDSVAHVVRAGSEAPPLVPLAQRAVHCLRGESDLRRGRRVDGHAHVGQVVNGVKLGGDVIPDLCLEFFVAVADFAGNVRVDVVGAAGAQEGLFVVVDGGEGLEAGVGDGFAVGKGRAGEDAGKGRAVDHGLRNVLDGVLVKWGAECVARGDSSYTWACICTL
jgi:hypothetical protein